MKTMQIGRERRARFLRETFAPGVYKGRDGTKILNGLYEIEENHLRTTIVPPLASRDALQMILHLYDETKTQTEDELARNPQDLVKWRQVIPAFRRALKHIAELFCIQRPVGQPQMSEAQASHLLESAIDTAEVMVSIYEASHRCYHLFPDHSEVEIFPEGYSDDFEVRITPPYQGYDVDFLNRVSSDVRNREKVITGPLFEFQLPKHAEILDPVFQSEFGYTYDRAHWILRHVIDDVTPAPDGFPTLFIARKKLDGFAAKLGVSIPQLNQIVDAFTVRAEALEAEGRVMWKPKQHHRALRRGFLEFPHETGPHLAFSRTMAVESLLLFSSGFCYQKIPEVWRTPAIVKAASRLSNAGGAWFERQVVGALASIGFQGRGWQGSVGSKITKIPIPSEVGQLDYLGVTKSKTLLVLLEVKMVEGAVEGIYWRDDATQFVEDTKSYCGQLLRKVNWVNDNRLPICNALGVEQPVELCAALVTLYPSFSQVFIQDFPCVSITEFVMHMARANETWPYNTGKVSTD